MNKIDKEINMEIVNVLNNHYMVECDNGVYFVFYVNDFTIQNLRNKNKNSLKVCVVNDDIDSIDLNKVKENSNHLVDLNVIIKILSYYKREQNNIGYKNKLRNDKFEDYINSNQII